MFANTTIVFVENINDVYFSLLVGETHNSTIKEYMIVGLRMLNTTRILLKLYFTFYMFKISLLKDPLFATHDTSKFGICGQVYDKKSNMGGDRGDIKNLILQKNQCICWALI